MRICFTHRGFIIYPVAYTSFHIIYSMSHNYIRTPETYAVASLSGYLGFLDTWSMTQIQSVYKARSISSQDMK